jgi:hypothetical protein
MTRRQIKTRPLTKVASASSLCFSSTSMTINLLPGKDCAVVAEEMHVARKVQQQCNDQARDFIETSVSMEIVKSTTSNIEYHYFNKFSCA